MKRGVWPLASKYEFPSAVQPPTKSREAIIIILMTGAHFVETQGPPPAHTHNTPMDTNLKIPSFRAEVEGEEKMFHVF